MPESKTRQRNRSRRQAGVMAMSLMLCVVACPALAGIPEPSVVLYGGLTIDDRAITAADGVTVVARVGGAIQPVGSYTMGDNPLAQDNYVCRIKVESLAGGSSPSDGAAQVGQTVSILIQQGVGPERLAATHTITAPGVVLHMDLSVRGGIAWDRAVYHDARYAHVWAGGSLLRDRLVAVGYQSLGADALKSWMDARIADHQPSVVVFAQDVAPDTVVETVSPACTLRRYLNAGGKVVWHGDVPLYTRGNADGTTTTLGTSGSVAVLGISSSGALWDSGDSVLLTAEGIKWGLQRPWLSRRPVVRPTVSAILAEDGSGFASGWVKHYVAGDTYRGFVRILDRPGLPSSYALRRVAVFGNVLDLPSDGDFSGDGHVDLVDYGVLNDCLAGSDATPAPTMPGVDALGCVDAFDTDGDGDVDLADFADLQDAFTGP